MGLLYESKKEDSIAKLQQKFPYDKNFIRRVFDLDPTYAGKYAPYIEKTLPSLIKGIAGENGGLSVGQQTRIEMVYQNIRWFELNYKYLTPKLIDEFLKDTELVDDPEQIIKSPKDINSYKNPFVLIALKDVVEKSRSDKEKESAARSQVNKLYEDENFLVVEPLSFVSSCYYGKNTKWCVSGNVAGESHFNSYLNKGRIIFFINKNIPQGKFALFIPKNLFDNRDNIQVWNDKDEETSIDTLYMNFSDISDFIDELTEYKGNFYKLLVGFVKGKVSAEEVISGDPLVNNMRGLKSENKESAILILKFSDDNDYFEVCALDDDDLGFVKNIFNPYYSMDLHDPYGSYDSWYDGHIIDYYFNDENKKKYDELVSLLDPSVINTDRIDPKVNNMVHDVFKKNINNIINNWSDKYNEALVDGNKDYILDDLGDVFFNFGIHRLTTFYKYFTTVGNLISLYDRFDPTKRKNLSDLLKAISLSEDVGRAYWDHVYDVNTDTYFDREGFNKDVSWELDQIMEKIEEDESFSQGIDFVKELNQKILSKYKMRRRYSLPSDSLVTFEISEIDKEGKKIEIVVSRKGKGAEKMKVTIPEFFQFLNTYPLFK